MAIEFSVGDFVVSNQTYIETLKEGPLTPQIKQALEILGYLIGEPSEVINVGNFYGPDSSYLHVVPTNVRNMAYNDGQGVVVRLPSDEMINNSFESSEAFLYDIQIIQCLNDSGSPILKNQIVRQTGFDPVEQLPTISLANAGGPTTSVVLGVVQEDLADGQQGSVLVDGAIEIDTTSFTLGQVVWLSDTPGAISATPGTEQVGIGRVLKVDTEGAISLFSTLTGGSVGGGGGGGFFTDGTGVAAAIGKGRVAPPIASGWESLAQGSNAEATGDYSIAFGWRSKAKGVGSAVFGIGNKDYDADGTFMAGSYNFAYPGPFLWNWGYHHVHGNDLFVQGDYDVAFGRGGYINGAYNITHGNSIYVYGGDNAVFGREQYVGTPGNDKYSGDGNLVFGDSQYVGTNSVKYGGVYYHSFGNLCGGWRNTVDGNYNICVGSRNTIEGDLGNYFGPTYRSRWCACFGENNTLRGGRNLATGQDNFINGYWNMVSGQDNIMGPGPGPFWGVYDSFCFGRQSYINNGYRVLVGGAYNYAYNAWDETILGNNNSTYGLTQNNLMCGSDNNLNGDLGGLPYGCEDNFIGGNANTISKSYYSLVHGKNCIINTVNAVGVFGERNSLYNNYSTAFGRLAKVVNLSSLNAESATTSLATQQSFGVRRNSNTSSTSSQGYAQSSRVARSIITSNSVPTTILTIPLDANKSYSFQANIIGNGPVGKHVSLVLVQAVGYREAAGAFVRGDPLAFIKDGTAAVGVGVGAQIGASGNNVIIQVIGEGTDTYVWFIECSYVEIYDQ